MKKILIIISLLALLASCGSAAPEAALKPPPGPEATRVPASHGPSGPPQISQPTSPPPQ